MDSFFKAAVCDLDKLLDDFELSSEEQECRSVFLKPPPAYPFSSLGPEAPVVPPSPPDLNSLRYGSAPRLPDSRPGARRRYSEDGEVKGRALTGVDLLSSVDHRPAQSSAPPCPDRALKPVCDLVNDTGSAVLVRADSRDAFDDPDVAEERPEAPLVDFDGPLETGGGAGREPCVAGTDKTPLLDSLEQVGGYSASLSLLDVILPAGASSDATPPRSPEPGEGEEAAAGSGEEDAAAGEMEAAQNAKDEDAGRSEECDGGIPEGCEAAGLSCLPLAVSMCSALVTPQDEELRDQTPERPEADGLEPSGESASQVLAEGRASPEGRNTPVEPERLEPLEPPGPANPPESGFEYLPESDRAELLVTDEELDAFLQAHSEAERERASGEPRRLGGLPEDPACPESDRTMCESAEGSPSPGASLPPDSCHDELSSGGIHSATSNSVQPQQPSHGGARPKRCQTARPPPAGEEEEEEEQEEAQVLSGSSKEEPNKDHEETPNADPELSEEHSSTFAPRELPEYSSGYDELSEPPPYPGESPTEGARPGGWGRKEAEELGSKQPAWVPDAEAPNCMNCYQRFTFTKRRHHCRACGKVFCAVCCNRKCKLKYLEKEARVCVLCFDTLNRAQALERMMSPTGPSPNPNVPSEYCSTIPPLQQARAAGTLNSPPPTVMVPVSVLKHPSNDGCPREQKRVWFADGILPNGEVADTTRLSVSSRRSSQEFSVSPDQTSPGSAGSEVVGPSTPDAPAAEEAVRPPPCGPWHYSLLSRIGSAVKRAPSLLPDGEDELPPLLIATGEDDAGDVLVEETPAPCQIRHLLEEGGPRPLTFVLNANLLVNVKLVTYSGRQCWCLGSNGLRALGQKELVFLLECVPEEKTPPRDLFTFCLGVYQDARRGKFLEESDNVTFTGSFLGSKDHGGMLFFPPSCQPLDGLTLPPPPFLFGLLVQKLEVPWAKVFPLRLLLRLGAEYNVYPAPLVSVRFRDSVYRETGHTIMNLLADLRNYQYSLSAVEGLRIHMEMGHSYIDIPRSSFSEVQKVVNSSNEHVISIGATFSAEADSHLVCFQNDEGNYQTQASSMPGKTRTVTGASFVVFNGALKASSGFIAKSSIVEDGLMVQIPPETMESLRAALRDQTDFHIPCGRADGGEVRENVTVRWVDRSSPANTGRSSGVDGRPLDGVCSVRLQQDADLEADGRVIRCTEVFYQPKNPDCSVASVLPSCAVFQKEMALAACGALSRHLAVLASAGINSLCLRVSTQADMVEYQAGCGGRLLPQRYMNELDGALIPVIHGGGAGIPQTPMDMEFVFYITHTL